MITEKGTISFEEADDSNIPVDIWLLENNEDDKNEGSWELHATNYTPRLRKLEESAYRAIGTREELVELIKKHVLPLYQNALQKLQNVCEGKTDNLYYWNGINP